MNSQALFLGNVILFNAPTHNIRVGLDFGKHPEILISKLVKRASTTVRAMDNNPYHLWGRGRDLNPGAGLHRPVGFQATSPRPPYADLDHS